MIKSKSKYKQTRLDVMRRFKKMSKEKVYTDDLREIEKEIRSKLVDGAFSRSTSGSSTHNVSKRLFRSVGHTVDSIQKIGIDFGYSISLGYVKSPPTYADEFEVGSDPQSVDFEDILAWVRKKPNFRTLTRSHQGAITSKITSRLNRDGARPHPVLETVWNEMKVEYVERVNLRLTNIWNSSATPF